MTPSPRELPAIALMRDFLPPRYAPSGPPDRDLTVAGKKYVIKGGPIGSGYTPLAEYASKAQCLGGPYRAPLDFRPSVSVLRLAAGRDGPTHGAEGFLADMPLLEPGRGTLDAIVCRLGQKRALKPACGSGTCPSDAEPATFRKVWSSLGGWAATPTYLADLKGRAERDVHDGLMRKQMARIRGRFSLSLADMATALDVGQGALFAFTAEGGTLPDDVRGRLDALIRRLAPLMGLGCDLRYASRQPLFGGESLVGLILSGSEIPGDAPRLLLGAAGRRREGFRRSSSGQRELPPAPFVRPEALGAPLYSDGED